VPSNDSIADVQKRVFADGLDQDELTVGERRFHAVATHPDSSPLAKNKPDDLEGELAESIELARDHGRDLKDLNSGELADSWHPSDVAVLRLPEHLVDLLDRSHKFFGGADVDVLLGL